MKLIDRRDFKTAAKIADGIDWRRVRNINMLTNVGCVYQAVGRYTDAKEIFQLARNRAPLGRRLVYQMADICIDAGEFEEAESYIQEFSELAPKDTARFELLYQLSRRKGEPIENQIAILEEFKKHDFDERWSFELAKLYHKAGYSQKCVSACDELILWFGEGQYVDKAMELKMLHAPLSPSQQEKYNMYLKKKQEENRVSVRREQKEEVHSGSNTKGRHQNGMYNTENLQAALTKSIQEIMEAEERHKASRSSGLSYFEEYQSEQEEREAMFAATRDLRREREKFKNMMTQPISSLIADRPKTEEQEFPKDFSIGDLPVVENQMEEDFEEKETRRVFEASEGSFEQAEMYDLPEEKTDVLFEINSGKVGKTSKGIWEETEDIFKEQRKEELVQKEQAEESQIKENLKDLEDTFLEETEIEKNLQEPEKLEEETMNFSEIDSWGDAFYYQVPEEEKEESEYVEVSFSLDELDTNEIPSEIYYRVSDYDPQAFLDKVNSQVEIDEEDQIEQEDIKEEEYEIEQDKQEIKEEIDFDAQEETFEEDFDQEELEYEEFPEEGTKEEFYQYIMLRSYGIDEMPEDTYYLPEGYTEKSPEEPEDFTSSEADEDNYVYGIEMISEDAYYEVSGYDPENYLAGRMEKQDFEAEILKQKPQLKPENSSERKPKSEVRLESTAREKQEKPREKQESRLEIQQENKKEEAPSELSLELKNLFANYLHMPGVEQQIAEILEETEKIGEESETSMFGNILLMGEVKSGKTTLAVSLIKTMNRLNERKGRKVAKISGDRLNNKGIKESISRLAGADLIIERAGEMRVSTVTELLAAMADYTGGMIVVLEDTRTSIERLLADVPQLTVCFTHRIELKECNIAEWAEAAKSYALENHYMVDDMAMLALSAKIDAICASKKMIMMEDVQDIIDDAIEKAERRNKKLFGRLFSKKKDSDSVILRESDFS